MPLPKFVVIDGKRYAWRDLLEKRREQRIPEPIQPALFDLKDDTRPEGERSAAGRYLEPSLFTLLDDAS